MKKSNLGLLIFKSLLFISVLVTGLIIRKYQPNIFDFFAYWWLLILIVFLGLNLHFKSKIYLFAAFILFFASAVVTVNGFKEVGELIMRISFIGWIVGIVQSAIEYKHST